MDSAPNQIEAEKKLETEPKNLGRLESIDQFRGFTVAGMFLVNFVGGYACLSHATRPFAKSGPTAVRVRVSWP